LSEAGLPTFRKLIGEGPFSEDLIQGLHFCRITRDECPLGKVNEGFWLCKIHRSLINRWNESKFRYPSDFIMEHERLTWKVTRIAVQLRAIENYNSNSPIQIIMTDGTELDQKFYLSSLPKSSSSINSIPEKPTLTLELPWSFHLISPRLRIEARTKQTVNSTTIWTLLGSSELHLARVCLPFIPHDAKRDCSIKDSSVTPFYITEPTSRMVEVELTRGKKKKSPSSDHLSRGKALLDRPFSTPLLPTLQFDLTWWTSRPQWDGEESYKF